MGTQRNVTPHRPQNTMLPSETIGHYSRHSQLHLRTQTHPHRRLRFRNWHLQNQTKNIWTQHLTQTISPWLQLKLVRTWNSFRLSRKYNHTQECYDQQTGSSLQLGPPLHSPLSKTKTWLAGTKTVLPHHQWSRFTLPNQLLSNSPHYLPKTQPRNQTNPRISRKTNSRLLFRLNLSPQNKLGTLAKRQKK